VLYVKLLILPDKGSATNKAEARPVRIEDATRKVARYKYSSLMGSQTIIPFHRLLATAAFSETVYNSPLVLLSLPQAISYELPFSPGLR
jgi:uncharacterized protein (UPF0248 family)